MTITLLSHGVEREDFFEWFKEIRRGCAEPRDGEVASIVRWSIAAALNPLRGRIVDKMARHLIARLPEALQATGDRNIFSQLEQRANDLVALYSPVFSEALVDSERFLLVQRMQTLDPRIIPQLTEVNQRVQKLSAAASSSTPVSSNPLIAEYNHLVTTPITDHRRSNGVLAREIDQAMHSILRDCIDSQEDFFSSLDGVYTQWAAPCDGEIASMVSCSYAKALFSLRNDILDKLARTVLSLILQSDEGGFFHLGLRAERLANLYYPESSTLFMETEKQRILERMQIVNPTHPLLPCLRNGFISIQTDGNEPLDDNCILFYLSSPGRVSFEIGLIITSYLVRDAFQSLQDVLMNAGRSTQALDRGRAENERAIWSFALSARPEHWSLMESIFRNEQGASSDHELRRIRISPSIREHTQARLEAARRTVASRSSG